MAQELEVRQPAAAVQQHNWSELERLARACAASGYFKDATDAAKAYVKIVAGAELGVGPVAAMTGIHIVQGKPTLSASLVGALIKRSGRYDYRVEHLSDVTCTLVFYENGEKVGESSFGISDAQTAGLTKNPVWKTFPRNMLLSRALTNGARWYCPDVFGGAVYTPDELGAVIDGETGELIGSVPQVEAPEPESFSVDAIAATTHPDNQLANAATLKAMEAHARSCGMDAETAAAFTLDLLDHTEDLTVGECKLLAQAMTEAHTDEQQKIEAAA